MVRDFMLRFVHLSDIHFSNRGAKFGFDPDRELRNRVLQDIATMKECLGPATAVLVTGDVAYAGQRAEYEDAARWLDSICDAAGCDRKEVLVCPGNHDIDRSVIKNNFLIKDGHDAVRRLDNPYDRQRALEERLCQADARSLFYAPLAAYNDFAERYQCSFFADEKDFVWGRDFRLNDGSTLRIRGLNSALLSGLADREGALYLGPRAYTLSKQAGVEYLTMSHHPPNWLLDKREAETALDGDARLHLFGHEHESRVTPGRDWVKLFAGAINPHRSELNWRPGYNIIELQVVCDGEHRMLHVDVHAREWQGNPPQFKAIEDRDNGPVHSVKLKLRTLPTEWRSPWVPDDAPENPIPGDDGMKTEGILRKEVNVAITQHHFRTIVYRFFRRTLSEKNEIVGTLRLAEEDDSRLVDVERFKQQLMRACERGQLDLLEAMITKLETGA
jgi:hypothetical protein